MNVVKRNHALWLIFFLALALRIYRLGDLPKTFYVEELTNTYVGKFILLHGKDITGHILPLVYFDKFGDYPPVLPLYLSGASALLLGTNEFAARLPVAVIGALLVFAVYELSMLIFVSQKASLFTSFITAILPWHIVLSRTTAEGIVGLTVYAFGIVWVLRGIGEKNQRLIVKSFLLFFLCYFLYPGLRILVPLTLVPLPFLADKTVRKALIIGGVCFILLTGYITTTKWGKARFEQTSIFGSAKIAESVAFRNKLLSDSLGPNQVLRARIFHNKITGYGREFLNEYLTYFSTKYLFYEAGGQYRYYNVVDQGLIFVSLLPFFLFALVPVLSVKRPLLSYILYLLVISPIPSALTVDFTPHAHRSVFMVLPLVIIAGSGYLVLLQVGSGKKLGVLGKRLGMLGMLGILGLEFIYFWNQYDQSSNLNTVLRNDGDREVAIVMNNERKTYDRVFAPIYERLPFYYLFYSNNFSVDLIGKFHDELQLDRIDNISFVKAWCPSTLPEVRDYSSKNILVVERGDCPLLPNYAVVTTIGRTDGFAAYTIRKPFEAQDKQGKPL